MSKKNRKTFASLDREKGYAELPPKVEKEFPLPAWYRKVYRIAIEDLTIADICTACRQQIHLDHVIPRALEILQSNPRAGDYYDGALLSAVVESPSSYWSEHVEEFKLLKTVCERFPQDAHTPRTVLRNIDRIISEKLET